MGKRYQATLLPSAARTASVIVEIPQAGFEWLYLHVDVTAVTATPTITISLEMFMEEAATWLSIGDAAAYSPTSPPEDRTFLFGLSQGIPEEGDLDEKVSRVPFGKRMRLNFVHGDTDSVTYSAEIIAGGDL